MSSKLVIVESPAKAKTIEKYLPNGYVVRASMGHIRDLPDNPSQMPKKFREESWAKLGVNVDSGFEAVYVVKDPRSKEQINELKSQLEGADELILATDEDREGEAISWHLQEVLKPKVPMKRMVFNEITKTAIQAALQATRDIDMNLVEAQETRRILDRLVGYPLSMLVKKKVKHTLSAGRVQSAAVRMLVLRERERRRFRVGSYWDLQSVFDSDGESFDGKLYSIDGTRLATGSDFDKNTGKIPDDKDVLLLDEASAKDLQEALKSLSFAVTEVSNNQYESAPKAPFTTSTLQQEASRKLGMGAKATMSVAQRLYENGHITYMRTDSTNLSTQAVDAARSAAKSLYGAAYIPATPRTYKGKSKGAQEAHEAIRPSGDAFTHPDKAGLSGQEARLYELIWMRTVACQMTNAKRTSTRVDLSVEVDGKTYVFRANGNKIDFPGHLRAYVEGSDDAEAALEHSERALPELAVDQSVGCESVEAFGHETRPPARYTEASLVKDLEGAGIGRPSTYATIMDKITTDERFATKQGRTLIPTFEAMAVTGLLENYFPELVREEFTSRMEDDLDEIASGQSTKVAYLHEFYREDDAFKAKIDRYEEEIETQKARELHFDDLPEDIVLRVGRYGPYAEMVVDGEEQTVNVPPGVAPADLTVEMLHEELAKKLAGPTVIGEHPETGEAMYLMDGRFGPYLQLGDVTEDNKKPVRSSIPKGVEVESIDYDRALYLLSLPLVLGKHPETEETVTVNNGRYGPYIKHQKDSRSLSKPEDIFTVTLQEALTILAQPKGRRGQTVLREMGEHPETGEDVNILDGRFGPYIKMGKINASVPRGTAPEDVTMDQAVTLLAERAAKMGEKKKKKPAKKKTTKKKTTKKKTTKKKASE